MIEDGHKMDLLAWNCEWDEYSAEHPDVSGP